jgi:hypothetical protein
MAVCTTVVLVSGCASDSGGGGGSGGANGTGGVRTGGQSGSGGSGSGGNGSGGAASGGSAGKGTGGTASGGSGGNSTGGIGSGGKASGGNGGSSSGGKAAGGSGSGGSPSGGTGSGGVASGGGAGSGSGGSGPGAGGNASGGAGGTSVGGAGGGSTGKGGATGGGGGAGGFGTAVGGTSTGGTSSKGGSSGSCSADTCPAPKGGVTVNCKKRFMYGVNFAWSTDADANFGTDFGGFATWNKKGVAASKAARTADMTDMKNNGVDVIRWWMFPSLGATDAVKLDSNRSPTGIGGTVVEDVNAALEIAASLDLHIKLTLFSFDNFYSDYTTGAVTHYCIRPIIVDDAKRAALIANVVVPIAKAVQSSPNRDRMVAWDAINEPEWVITGTDGYGDQPFDPQASGSAGPFSNVTFTEMKTFVKDVVTALHANSSAPVTVGGAAVKWAKAWSEVGLDFYDFHWYGWVDQYFPHTKTPADYKVDDKQVVVGEFPLVPGTSGAFGGISYGKLIDDFLAAGYAGAQGWAFSETSGTYSWADSKPNVKSWADANKCYTHY